MNYILNGAQIENMATQLNKANRTAIRQCECEKIAAENKRLKAALTEITRGEGSFSSDPLTHASNTIDNLIEIAQKALESES